MRYSSALTCFSIFKFFTEILNSCPPKADLILNSCPPKADLTLSVDMKGTYDKYVVSALVSLDILWSTLDIRWSTFGVLLNAFGCSLMRADER